EVVDPLEQRLTGKAREMAPAHAPVEAALAHRPPRARIERLDAEARQECFATLCQLNLVAVDRDRALACEAVEHLHPELACQVVVAPPGMAHGRLLRSGPHTRAGTLRHAHDLLEHLGDVVAGKAEIAVASLLQRADQPAAFEPREMGACGL